MTRVARHTVTVAAGLVLAGCSSTSTAGTPQPEATSSTTAPPVAEVAVSPREFDVTILDTCALIPEDRRAELGLNRPPGRSDRESEDFINQCSISSSTSTNFSAVVYPELGAEDLIQRAGGFDAIVDTVEHEGFTVPITKVPSDAYSACTGLIATTDTTAISILANGTLEQTPEEACRVLTTWVPIVLDTLQELQP